SPIGALTEGAIMDSPHAQLSAAELLDELLASDREITDFLNQLAHLAAVELTDELPVLVGITLERNKRTTIAGSSDAEARKIDEVQAGFDEGPCLEAQSRHRLIEVTDVRNETRRPDYMEVIRRIGLRNVLAVPLDLDGMAQAAMNFYTTAPNAFDEARTASAQEFAMLASRALRVAVRVAQHEAGRWPSIPRSSPAPRRQGSRPPRGSSCADAREPVLSEEPLLHPTVGGDPCLHAATCEDAYRQESLPPKRTAHIVESGQAAGLLTSGVRMYTLLNNQESSKFDLYLPGK